MTVTTDKQASIVTTSRGLLTVPQVCDTLRVSKATFYAWRPDRGPRCVRLPNGRLRVRRRDIDKWLPGALDGLLTLDELCTELEIAESTFRDWRARRIAPPHAKLPNGALRFPIADLNDWLRTREEVAA